MPSSTLARDFLEIDRKEVDQATAEYTSMLRSNASEPASIRELRRVASRLGKSASQVAADAQFIAHAQTRQKFIEDNRNIAEQLQAATDRMMRSHENMTNEILRLRKEHERVVAEYDRLGGINRNLREARLELEKMASDRPDLLRKEELKIAA